MFKKKSTIFLLVLVFILIAVTSFGYFVYRSGKVQEFVLRKMTANISEQNTEVDLNFVRSLMGFDAPRNFLVLFLNNTELRPAGGFIGVYAVVKIDKGVPSIVKVEGTEILDNNAPKDFVSVPPAPIKKYLKVDRWYFRDSNWSPDFAAASQKSLELYQKERGTLANDIDVVVGFTPTVLEKFLKIVGPINVDGMEFNADNFTEKLEYEVEYGYAEKNVSFDDRKKILEKLTKKMITAAGKDIFSSWVSYKGLFEDMTREKQLMFYSGNEALQENFAAHNWSGEMKNTAADYLLWVDANLGALKTDYAMERQLSYNIFKKDKKYYGRVTMKYEHTGGFDWRTTRYLSYTRLFVPKDSKLIGDNIKDIEQGEENGRRWFGTYIQIEPGKKFDLTFEFELAASVAEKIEQKDYSLLCQKQPGTNGVGLTVKLEFDNKVVSAAPKENQGSTEDKVFDYADVLDSDKYFKINFD